MQQNIKALVLLVLRLTLYIVCSCLSAYRPQPAKILFSFLLLKILLPTGLFSSLFSSNVLLCPLSHHTDHTFCLFCQVNFILLSKRASYTACYYPPITTIATSSEVFRQFSALWKVMVTESKSILDNLPL